MQMTMRDIMMATGYHDSQWRRYGRGGGVTLASLLKIAVVLKTTPSVLDAICTIGEDHNGRRSEARQIEPWKCRSRAKRGTVKQSHPSPRSLEDAGKLASPTFPQLSKAMSYL
jgi:hypothetical protein